MTNAEIQVGEYVRTKNGVIRKAEEVLKGNYVNIDDGFFDTDYDDYRWGLEPDEIKVHSFNIIDLIEVGDYVNGYQVETINYEEDENGNLFNVLGVVFTDDDYAYSKELKDINIHSIVTKEQFKSMEYKVGGEDD